MKVRVKTLDKYDRQLELDVEVTANFMGLSRYEQGDQIESQVKSLVGQWFKLRKFKVIGEP
jgi:hypothetical protein